MEKKQLIQEIEKFYPFETKNIKKYAELFIGGGAVLFVMYLISLMGRNLYK